MVLSLPGRVLALGTNLAPVAPAADHSGARDWAVLEQRMHYIVHLFRAFHEQHDLFDPPFTPAQIDRIAAGAIPDGDI
jgi:hypothetical protein